MKSVYINAELHQRAKVRAAQEGTTLRALVERQIRLGLDAEPTAGAGGVLGEPVSTYALATPTVEQPVSASELDDPLAALEAQGYAIRGERLQRKLADVTARPWEQLGMEPPQGPPVSIQEIRSILDRYQQANPDVPTVSQLVLEMREGH